MSEISPYGAPDGLMTPRPVARSQRTADGDSYG